MAYGSTNYLLRQENYWIIISSLLYENYTPTVILKIQSQMEARGSSTAQYAARNTRALIQYKYVLPV